MRDNQSVCYRIVFATAGLYGEFLKRDVGCQLSVTCTVMRCQGHAEAVRYTLFISCVAVGQ